MKSIYLSVLLLPVLALAHHGYTQFNQTKTIELNGVVTEFHYTNPHCIIDFDVKKPDGTVENWRAELSNPLHLKGWTASSLEAGVTLTVTGYPAKNGTFNLWLTSMKASNGVEIKPGNRIRD